MPWCVSICQLDTENAPESSLKGENQKKGAGSKKNNEHLVELQVCFWSRMFWSWDLLQAGFQVRFIVKKKSSIFPHGFEKAVWLGLTEPPPCNECPRDISRILDVHTSTSSLVTLTKHHIGLQQDATGHPVHQHGNGKLPISPRLSVHPYQNRSSGVIWEQGNWPPAQECLEAPKLRFMIHQWQFWWWHGWWKKSCTTWDVQNPVLNIGRFSVSTD